MTEEEIRTLQQMRDAILKKTRSSLGIQEISDKVKQLVVPDMGTIKEGTFETPSISDNTWKRNEYASGKKKWCHDALLVSLEASPKRMSFGHPGRPAQTCVFSVSLRCLSGVSRVF